MIIDPNTHPVGADYFYGVECQVQQMKSREGEAVGVKVWEMVTPCFSTEDEARASLAGLPHTRNERALKLSQNLR